MTTGIALIAVLLALGGIISAGVAIPRRQRSAGDDVPASTGQLESELLRRPLRSRRSA